MLHSLTASHLSTPEALVSLGPRATCSPSAAGLLLPPSPDEANTLGDALTTSGDALTTLGDALTTLGEGLTSSNHAPTTSPQGPRSSFRGPRSSSWGPESSSPPGRARRHRGRRLWQRRGLARSPWGAPAHTLGGILPDPVPIDLRPRGATSWTPGTTFQSAGKTSWTLGTTFGTPPPCLWACARLGACGMLSTTGLKR